MHCTKSLLLALFISLTSLVSAQNKLEEDSLKAWILDIKQVTENYPDSARGLIRQLRRDNPDLSLEIEADLLKTEGAAAAFMRDLDTAQLRFTQAGDTYEKMIDQFIAKGDTLDPYFFETIKSRSNIINNVGSVAYFKQDYETAVESFIKAAQIQETLLDCPIEPVRKKAFEDLAMSTDNIGAIYSVMNQARKSLEYRMKAHDMIGDRNDRNAMRVKMNIAMIYLKLDDLDSAQIYGREVFQNADTATMANEYHFANSLLGEYHLDNDRLDSAYFYLSKAHSFANKVGVNIWTENHYQRMAQYYLKTGNYQEALKNINISYDMAKSTGTQGNLTVTYRLLFEIYHQLASQGGRSADYEKALDYMKKYVDLNDSLVQEQRFKDINELQSKYETEKKEAENRFLKEEAELKEQTISDQQLWIITIGVLFVVALGLLYFQIRARRQLASQKELIQNQKNKLSELDASKSRFFANLSHDLRTPITLIMGNLKIIGSDEGGYLSAQGELSKQKAYANAQKLLSLSDEIRDLTSLESGRVQLQLQKVRMPEYLTLLNSMFKSAADIKGVKLVTNIATDRVWEAHIDPRQFEKIIYNLLSNALKFTEKGGTIQLDLEAQSDDYTIRIQDTGVGINQAQLPYIFDRYYQSPENEYRNTEGLGIGLSLVRELVLLHGGQVTADSEPGKGTTFTITLPKNLDKPAESFVMNVTDYLEQQSDSLKYNLKQDQKGIALDNNSQKEHTILIVDDHQEIREYIATFLIKKYNVFYATNGMEALEMIEKAKIDLIITDLMMPVMDGFELLDVLQENNIQIPTMVVSARTLSEDRQKILAKGVNEIITKPFEDEEFRSRVSNILTKKGTNLSDIVTSRDMKKELQNDILIKINELIKERLTDTRLSVGDLAKTIFASERKTFRLIKELTGLTPLEYITDYRLQVAEQLLKVKEFSSLSEISKAVGINSTTRFTKVFTDKYGYSPSDLLK